MNKTLFVSFTGHLKLKWLFQLGNFFKHLIYLIVFVAINLYSRGVEGTKWCSWKSSRLGIRWTGLSVTNLSSSQLRIMCADICLQIQQWTGLIRSLSIASDFIEQVSLSLRVLLNFLIWGRRGWMSPKCSSSSRSLCFLGGSSFLGEELIIWEFPFFQSF